MLLAFTGAINASTTHYANGPASILATTGYVRQNEWWKMNFVLGIVYILIFGIVGTLWMKVLVSVKSKVNLGEPGCLFV